MNAKRYPELSACKSGSDLRRELGYSPMGDSERDLLARHYARIGRRHCGTWDSPYWLPRIGMAALLTGMVFSQLYYWSTNQTITQRALAAPSIREAQKGVYAAAVIR